MDKNTAICDVSVFVSKSKYSSIKDTIRDLGIEEVILPKELIDILLKVYRKEELSGEEVRVLSYWSRGPVPSDEDVRTFFEELISQNLKIRTVQEYTLRKEVEYGYEELKKGEEHEEMRIYNKTWKALVNKFCEFLPQKAAVIVSKIISLGLVFNVKIIAFSDKLMTFIKKAKLPVSRISTSIELKSKRYTHLLLFLKSYGNTRYSAMFHDAGKMISETLFVPFDLERNVSTIVILMDS
ncbi:MAG: hypothetical protein ACXQTP_01350 [Candidatus Methanofastidiosia archaeon]